jgi:WD40 repeat protein
MPNRIKEILAVVIGPLWLLAQSPPASWADRPRRDEPKYLLRGRGPVAFSRDGKRLATGGHGGDGTVTVWDVATGKPLRSLGTKHTEGRWSEAGLVAFSPDGAMLATVILDYPGLDDNINGGIARLWDWRMNLVRSEFRVKPAAAELAAFSADVRTLAIGAEGGDIILFDTCSARPKATLRPPQRRGFKAFVDSLAFSPDGKALATTMADAGADMQASNFVLRIWDTPESRVRLEFALPTQFYGCSVWSPDGRLVAVAETDAVALHDSATGRIAARLEVCGPPGGSIEAIDFAPDGRTLAAGMIGTKSVLWDIATRKELRRISYGRDRSIRFSPDSKLLAVGMGGRTAGDCEECAAVRDVSR